MNWVGVSDVAPNSRGAHVDAQELAVLEVLHGAPFVEALNGGSSTSNPTEQRGELLSNMYDEFVNYYGPVAV